MCREGGGGHYCNKRKIPLEIAGGKTTRITIKIACQTTIEKLQRGKKPSLKKLSINFAAWFYRHFPLTSFINQFSHIRNQFRGISFKFVTFICSMVVHPVWSSPRIDRAGQKPYSGRHGERVVVSRKLLQRDADHDIKPLSVDFAAERWVISHNHQKHSKVLWVYFGLCLPFF